MIAAPRPLPPADAHPEAAAPLDIVFIEGLAFETVIGIDDGELHDPQPLVLDLEAGVPHAPACDTDRIADTIHYGLVRERLLVLARAHRHQLLESFAEHVAAILIDEFGAHWVRVKLAKPRKFADVRAVGVQIERRRAARAAPVLHLIASGMCPPRR